MNNKINIAETKKYIETKKHTGFLYELKKNKALFLMLLPAVLVLLINNYLPMFGVILAFKDYNYVDGFLHSPWCGFNNFKYLFNSNNAFIITRNTLLYNAVFITISITFAVFIAIVLHEITNRKLSKVYQSIIFLPYFLSWVVVSYLVFALLSSDVGFINSLRKSFGLKGISWYTEPKYWPYILILVNTWKWTGYDSVIFLATIVGFNEEYYEAAVIDGATRWQQITKITLPLLKPIITILALLKIGKIFYADFGLFWNIPRNSGILFDVTNVIDTYVYRSLIDMGDIGMATAAGFYQAMVGFILVFLSNWVVRKVNPENALF